MRRPLAGSTRIPAIYVVAGVTWIVASDIWVRGGRFVPGTEMLKGTLFVLISGALVHWLLARDESRVDSLRSGLEDAEVKAAQGESLLTAIERAVPSGLVTFGRDATVLSWSPAMTGLLGWRERDCVGHPLPGLAPEEAEALARSIDSVAGTGTAERRTLQLTREDGAAIVVVCDLAPLSRSDVFGGEAPVISSFTDVTELERLRRDLTVVAERWRLGVEAVGEGLLDWDLASGRLTPTPRARQLLDIPPNVPSIGAEELDRLIWPEDLAEWKGATDRLLSSRQRQRVLFRVRTPGTPLRWLRQNAVVATESDGTPVRILLSLADRTAEVLSSTVRDVVGGLHADLIAAVPLEESVRRAGERMLDPFGATHIAVFLRNGDGRTQLAARASFGPFGEIWSRTLGEQPALPRQGSTLRAMLEGRTVTLDYESPESTPELTALSWELGVASAISAPLRAGDEVVGAASLYARWRGTAHPQLIASFEAIASTFGSLVATHAARERMRMSDAAVASTVNGIAILDADGAVVQANAACTTMLRCEPGALIGADFATLIGSPGDGLLDELLEASRDAGQADRRDFVLRHADGLTHIHVTRSPIIGPEGRPTHTVAVLEDLSERRRQEERIAHLARYDALTDLPNRPLFLEQARLAIARAEHGNEKVAMLFLDLDHFKQINDSLGHAVGDSVLRATATRLAAQLRPGDIIARFGGDEFVILLGTVRDAAEAGALARRLLSVHEEPIGAGGILHHVGISIGIALFPEDGRELDDLLRHADLAMYRAKSDGRQTVSFFQRQMDERTLRCGTIERALHSALAHDEFRVVYQPQLRLRDGALVGAEALIRWRSRELGDVPPGDFIPVAENLGVIRPVGAQVLMRASRDAARWGELGFGDLRVAVNLSMAQFRSHTLAEELAQQVRATGHAIGRMELEITESMLAEDADRAARTLQELHAAGFELAIDDFGTGYSSMFALQRYPLRRIKIDRSFVKDLETDPSSATIVRATVDLAHALGLAVIAEGVETEGQEGFLREVGCDEVQGYRYARPLEVPEFEEWVRRYLRRAPGDGMVLTGS